jgi:anti-sigma factor RsiW
MTEERLAELMVTVVDGVASPAEREELMAYIADKPDLGKQLESHQALKALTDGWVERLQLDLAIDRAGQEPTTSLALQGGAGLFVLSTVGLTAWGLMAGVLDAEAPLAVRLGLAGLGLSMVLLFVGGLRWWSATRSVDRYQEVIR